MNAHIAVLAGTARPNFLVLTPACVFLGIAVAGAPAGAPGQYVLLALALAGALLAHVSVNMLNEYEDFRNGLDLATERTPFSGGSGTLPKRPGGAQVALQAGRLALGGTLLAGVVLLYYRGPALLPLGLLGLLLVATYSTHIVRWPLASLIAPGLGFGPIMVMGTAFVVMGEFTVAALVASLVPFFLVSDLLLLNQFPDVEPDRDAGRRNLPIALGRRASSLVYGGFLACGFGAIVAGIGGGYLPATAGLALVPGLAAPVLAVRVHRHAEDLERLRPLLGWNVVLTLGTIVLLGAGVMLG